MVNVLSEDSDHSAGDSQGDLNHCWAHMSEGTFSEVAAKISFLNIPYGPRQGKRCLQIFSNYADSDFPAHSQSRIRAFLCH